MRQRIKPFPYDAIETKDVILVVFPSQNSTAEPAAKTVTQLGLQIDRPDGVVIRISNLHPRFRAMLETKPVFAVEIAGDHAVLYPVGNAPTDTGDLSELLAEHFYWFIGPETSTIQEAGRRPLAVLFSHILRRPMSIAPGETQSGPCIGLCQSHSRFLALPRGRKWAQASTGIIIDAGLAAGTTSGYPANDNIPSSVKAAHAEQILVPQFRTRRAWSSQIGCAFPAIPDHPNSASAKNSLEHPA